MTGTSSTKILQEQINLKADQNWAKAKFESIEKDESETREIALSAKRELAREKVIKIGAVFAVMVIIGGVLASHFSVKNQAQNTAEAMDVVQSTVTEMQEDLEYVKIRITEDPREEEEKERKRAEAIADAVKKALETKPATGRRSR